MNNSTIILSSPGQARIVKDQTVSPQVPLLDIAACGICATDRKGFQSPPASMKLPIILGHEFCGILRTTGKRAVVWPAISCGHCPLCSHGQDNLCENIQLFGLHLDGGYQQLFSLPPALAEKAVFMNIPPQLSWIQASMAEPLGCVIHCLSKVKQVPDSLCIYGAGLMGCLAVRVSQHKWPLCQIEVLDPEPTRQKKFTQNHNREQVDLVFLACSNPTAVSDSLDRLKPGGQMLLFSGLDRDSNPFPIDYNRIHRLEQTLHGSYGCLPADMSRALNLMARGSIEVDDLITNIVDFEQVPNALKKKINPDEFKTVITIN
jgi:L-iditol 2-dehydrogenase